ncbi:MAG TPA: hypothetical protein VEW42_04845 [Candidatus Eisenbacteria bacterium]|nr:hypothetical protein [Candidatus Eisenbacteria bacterium]
MVYHERPQDPTVFVTTNGIEVRRGGISKDGTPQFVGFDRAQYGAAGVGPTIADAVKQTNIKIAEQLIRKP